MTVRLPTLEEIERLLREPPRRPPFGFYAQIEGRVWPGEPDRLKLKPPTLAPLCDYLERGGRFTPDLRAWLVAALREDGESEFVISIRRRKSGAPKANENRMYEVGRHIQYLCDIGIKKESAIQDAMTRFRVSRSYCFEAQAYARRVDDGHLCDWQDPIISLGDADGDAPE